MPKFATVYDLLISCPSDVTEFIPIITKEVNLFNNYYGRQNNIVIRTLHWSTDAYSQLGNSPQALLNEQIVDTCDLAISVLWTRFGTPTEEYGSGTEEEIERLISQGKQVFLFFITKPVNLAKADLKQCQKVQEFMAKQNSKGLYCCVENENELARRFRENLERYFSALTSAQEFKKASESKRILWVDDSPENNGFERTILSKQYGLKFNIALSTEQALDLMKYYSFDLVISDMGRDEGPEEGYVLLEEIRKHNKQVPFIVYTGFSTSECVQKIQQRGGQGCTDDLNELINMVIKNLLKA